MAPPPPARRLTLSDIGIPRALGVACAFAVVNLAAACSDATSGKTSGTQLGFTTGAALGANADAVPITANGHTLSLTAMTLTVSRVELKPAVSAVCAGETDGGGSGDGQSTTAPDECDEMKIGPTTIDVPLDGSVVTLPADAIPAGTYQGLELRLAFVRLQGTFDGKSFDVTVATPVRGEIQFTTPIVVTAGTGTSITVTVPVAKWLTNADGSLVDPSQLNSNPALLTPFIGRIASLFHAFEDENHDGHDDHG
jgi:hypothetical protein